MKNNIIKGLILSVVILIGGWATSYDFSQELKKVIIEQHEQIEQKSTKIANLENVIVNRDTELKARTQVIDEQKLQINKQEEESKKLKEENKKLKEEIANFKKKKKGSGVQRQPMVSRGKVNAHKTVNVVATAYIALCDTGCTGITATGLNVMNTASKKIIAVDPSVIPLHSKVKVSLPSGETFYAVAEDTGGDIKGGRIDILMATHSEAVSFGRQNATVTILK